MPETAPKVNRGKSVRYTGTADVREISAAQFKGAGVEGAATVRWDRSNGHTVKSTDLAFLDDEQFTRIISDDTGLKVES